MNSQVIGEISPEGISGLWRVVFMEKKGFEERQHRDAALIRCGLKFVDIHYKFKSSHLPKARLQSYRHTGAK